jgi:hypothetical protein
MSRRTWPNILVCGTPGTGATNRFLHKGKTRSFDFSFFLFFHFSQANRRLSEQLCQRVSELQAVDVNEVVKAKALHDGSRRRVEFAHRRRGQTRRRARRARSVPTPAASSSTTTDAISFLSAGSTYVVVLRADNSVLFDRLAGARLRREQADREHRRGNHAGCLGSLPASPIVQRLSWSCTSNSVDDLDNNTRQIVDHRRRVGTTVA